MDKINVVVAKWELGGGGQGGFGSGFGFGCGSYGGRGDAGGGGVGSGSVGECDHGQRCSQLGCQMCVGCRASLV